MYFAVLAVAALTAAAVFFIWQRRVWARALAAERAARRMERVAQQRAQEAWEAQVQASLDRLLADLGELAARESVVAAASHVVDGALAREGREDQGDA